MRSRVLDQTPLGAIGAAALFALCLAQADRALATDTSTPPAAVSAMAPAASPGPDTRGPAPATQGADQKASAMPTTTHEGTSRRSVADIRAAMAAAEQDRQRRLVPDPGPSKALLEKWGVQVIGISRTAGGYMLDFRFHVVDAEKALPLFDHRIKPYAVADKADVKLPVPVGAKVGALRPTNRGRNITSNKTYYMVFANPDSFVKPGDEVSVVIGDFRAEHLTVN
jgi:hypothetical protein